MLSEGHQAATEAPSRRPGGSLPQLKPLWRLLLAAVCVWEASGATGRERTSSFGAGNAGL